MSIGTCPHQVPSVDHRRGWYCRREKGCFYPKCLRTDVGGTPSGTGKNASQKCSDSPLNSGTSGDFTPSKGEFTGSNIVNPAKLSDSPHCERVWQWVGPYESKGREYFRYQWGIGRKVKETIHIPGGSRFNPVALKRARQVWVGINKQGWTVQQTKDFISPWRSLRAKL